MKPPKILLVYSEKILALINSLILEHLKNNEKIIWAKIATDITIQLCYCPTHNIAKSANTMF